MRVALEMHFEGHCCQGALQRDRLGPRCILLIGIREMPGRILCDLTFPTNRCSVLNTSEKAMAPHSSTLAWKIPWTKEPGGLQSMGSRRVGRD